MLNTAIQALDLANYAGMATRMFPASLGLAICADDGSLLKASDDDIADHAQTLAAARPDWAAEVQDLEHVEVANDGSVMIMNLQSDTGMTPVFLLWWLGEPAAGEASADMHDTLLSLAVCIRNELQLQTELDSMALELSERYEELNLVYHTDDQVSYFREGYEAFRALVQNCSDYLDAGLAVLHMREKGVLVESRTDLDATDMRLIQSVLDDYLYDRVIGSCDVEFLNNEGNGRGNDAAHIPYRLMAGPIMSFGDQADGVLVIANLLSSKSFSNSDKNLLSVMSRKVAKIVQGSYDGLTGLLNRASFEHLINNELEHIRHAGGSHCLLHLNIDKLHRINETLGHDAGDMIVRRFADAIAEDLRETDKVARIGGDEIGVLIHGCHARKGISIAEKILRTVANLDLEWQGEQLHATASAGVAVLDQSSRTGEQVMKQAVIACDLAKDDGGDSAVAYEPDQASLQEREASMWMVGTVHSALRENRFLLYAQPITPLKPSGGAHLEILLRMDDGEKIVSPHAFLPASERYQLMTSIDRWVVENSLVEIGLYLDGEPRVRPVFGINLSGQSFNSTEFLEFAIATLDKSGVPPELICFEITETAAVSNMARAQDFIAALRAKGCQFALDDFGAGVSSFGYLKSFDVQYLKIDGALVRDIVEDKVNAAMVESVHQIGHVMGLQTIAEFVETEAARALLTKMGVDYIQGYLISKPGPLQEQLAIMNDAPALSAL
ncbi:MAG: EAL domain-containing protein [Gammaproteobacteria bacterium]|nr:EAL domain-containing protein [Gammaproteobacteria bacterium]